MLAVIAAVVWAAAACVSPGAPGTRSERAAAAPGRAAGAAEVRAPGRRSRVEAIHGGAIEVLAATADGGAAVTSDALGEVRLWPTLDGGAEPYVVDLPRPVQLAIGRERDGFLIEMIDAAGGLVLQRVDRNGIPNGLAQGRTVLPVEPAVTGVAMSSAGALAWRADAHVLLFGPGGAAMQELAAGPGERIAAVAAAGPRAIALLEVGKQRKARWLELTGGLRWGAWVALDEEPSPRVSLSPTARRLATLVAEDDGTARALVLDTATGALVASVAVSDAVALGLVADDHLALAMEDGPPAWIRLASPPPVQRPRAGRRVLVPATRPVLGVGGGRAITAHADGLVIAASNQVEYLGYELAAPLAVAPASRGRVAVWLGEAAELLGADLREASPLDLAIGGGAAAGGSRLDELRWLGGEVWLVRSSGAAPGSTVAIVDAARKRRVVVADLLGEPALMRYEPATRLLALSEGERFELRRYEPAGSSLAPVKSGAVGELRRPGGSRRVLAVPVDPSLADGAVLVEAWAADRLVLRWARDPAEARSITLDGSLGAIGPAGHAYVWQSSPARRLELNVYRDGQRLGVLPGRDAASIWPAPDGRQVALVDPHGVSVLAPDGSLLWTQPFEEGTEALWLDDGTLVVAGHAGVARYDAATGALRAARCGWRFRRSPRPLPDLRLVAPVCAQLR